jgi:hypothetical protein
LSDLASLPFYENLAWNSAMGLLKPYAGFVPAEQQAFQHMAEPGWAQKAVGAGEALATLAPWIGPSAAGTMEQARRGDIAGALGSAGRIGMAARGLNALRQGPLRSMLQKPFEAGAFDVNEARQAALADYAQKSIENATARGGFNNFKQAGFAADQLANDLKNYADQAAKDPGLYREFQEINPKTGKLETNLDLVKDYNNKIFGKSGGGPLGQIMKADPATRNLVARRIFSNDYNTKFAQQQVGDLINKSADPTAYASLNRLIDDIYTNTKAAADSGFKTDAAGALDLPHKNLPAKFSFDPVAWRRTQIAATRPPRVGMPIFRSQLIRGLLRRGAYAVTPRNWAAQNPVPMTWPQRIGVGLQREPQKPEQESELPW